MLYFQNKMYGCTLIIHFHFPKKFCNKKFMYFKEIKQDETNLVMMSFIVDL